MKSKLLTALLLTLGLTGIGLAEPVNINVERGRQTGFSFSWIHHNGKKLFSIEGTLMGELTRKPNGFLNLEIGPQSLSLTGLNIGYNGTYISSSDDWELRISGANIMQATSGGLAAGTLDYQIVNNTTGQVFSTGTFSFLAKQYTGPANSISLTDLFLWGSNYQKGKNKLGMDLGAWITPKKPPTGVPEPATLGLLGLGLVGAAFFRRKR